MYPQIRNLFILLSLLCFWVGCTQVKQIVTDVKEGFTESFKSGKETTPAPPPEAKETKPQPESGSTDKGTATEVSPPPAKSKTTDTKTVPAPSKKGSSKKTPSPAGDVFGPK